MVELTQQEAEVLRRILKRLAPSSSSATAPSAIESQSDPFDEYSEEEISRAMQQLACSDDELKGMRA